VADSFVLAHADVLPYDVPVAYLKDNDKKVSTSATGLSSICLSSRTCLEMLIFRSISDEIIDIFHFKCDQIYDEKKIVLL
jgi:hypothetical protein